MEVEQHDAGPECDLLGLAQRAGDEQLRRRHVLPREHHVLADPDFGEAEPVGPSDELQVLVVGLGRRSPRRVERHHEQTELHLVSSWASLAWFCTRKRRAGGPPARGGLAARAYLNTGRPSVSTVGLLGDCSDLLRRTVARVRRGRRPLFSPKTVPFVPFVSGGWNTWPVDETPGVALALSEWGHRGTKSQDVFRVGPAEKGDGE